ncbi:MULTISPECIES: 1-aminocyclopropane-1-carboxylate deaminase/D-cysteine desulfhydrase [Sphingobacterium]|uniref:Pyridoxal-phosphate dependent enzyme n=1 Tax=Sphingobacterium tenebrionis TaxID=3111775 RepID=A0ABU8I783_9SPHI|nr:pyridoxal-phosphate dependent enzyme [Sphingobacterium sp. CZ-2]QBR11216.1 pyridoxal-phosphate dependent enzyme [Sphingobacterium sp. CZ-2]
MLSQFPIHSPEEEINHPVFSKKAVQVFIKRDDKIHPFISGNKWRKLKYSLQEAKNLNKNLLVTFGGAWSNHLLATAAAAAQFGFQSQGIVRGESVDNPVLAMCRLFGMKLQFIDRSSYREKESYFNNHFDSSTAYFIDEGGRSNLGVLGCKEIIPELQQEYAHIITAAGTGTTAAGLLQGIDEANLASRLHVIPVLKNGGFIKDDIEKFEVSTKNMDLHLDYHFSGYGKSNPELIHFIKDFVASTGIMIEPVYTGKAMYGLVDLIKKDYFKPGSRILFLHTGGLTGLLGQLNLF